MVKDYEAHIDLIVEKYCYKRPYRCTIEDKKEIEEQIAKLLEKKLIEESYSPFAAPVTLAYKREENEEIKTMHRLQRAQQNCSPSITTISIDRKFDGKNEKLHYLFNARHKFSILGNTPKNTR